MSELLLDIIYMAGVAAVAVGAGLIYLPAGLIVGGALAIVSVYLFVRGGGARS